MIDILPSQTADSRTCDFANVDRDTLLAASVQHIGDVRRALSFFSDLLRETALRHDYDKISDIDGFYANFVTGFAQTDWLDRHYSLNRHHLNAQVPDDVNLIDVLDMIADCVMAGMARSGLRSAARSRRSTVGQHDLLVRNALEYADAAGLEDPGATPAGLSNKERAREGGGLQ